MCDAAPDREVVTTRDSSQLRAGRSNNARSVQRNLLVTSAAEREGGGLGTRAGDSRGNNNNNITNHDTLSYTLHVALAVENKRINII